MANNILYRSDCKEALQNLINKGVKVDLIYLDPPFNSSRTYNILYHNKGVTAQHKAFHDMWTLTSQNQQLLLRFEELIDGFQEVSDLVKSFLKVWIAPLKSGVIEDQRTLLYLIYMTERLVLMKQILKPSGSIYYHCDPTSSHYIKIIMDGIFGHKNFRNEVVWWYDTGGMPKNDFARKHDIILRYSLTNKYHFNSDAIKEKKSDTMINRFQKYSHLDIRISSEYKHPHDVLKIHAINPNAKERRGYPTQKPVVLLDKIIKSSCPQDGTVLDPFCGCGTTISSAIKHNLQWIGIDISYDAIGEIKDRIKEETFDDNVKYDFIDGSPETKAEYDNLDPFAKQDWLIRKLGGFPNPKKSGDGGVDGDMTIHLGTNQDGVDKWGKLVFSVKTGKQCKPEFIRELKGTMQDFDACMGCLILDVDPTPNMEIAAQKRGQIKYVFNQDLPPNFYDRIQIITSQEIIDDGKLLIPPTIKDIKLHRGETQLGF